MDSLEKRKAGGRANTLRYIAHDFVSNDDSEPILWDKIKKTRYLPFPGLEFGMDKVDSSNEVMKIIKVAWLCQQGQINPDLVVANDVGCENRSNEKLGADARSFHAARAGISTFCHVHMDL